MIGGYAVAQAARLIGQEGVVGGLVDGFELGIDVVEHVHAILGGGDQAGVDRLQCLGLRGVTRRGGEAGAEAFEPPITWNISMVARGTMDRTAALAASQFHQAISGKQAEGLAHRGCCVSRRSACHPLWWCSICWKCSLARLPIGWTPWLPCGEGSRTGRCAQGRDGVHCPRPFTCADYRVWRRIELCVCPMRLR